MNPVLIEKRVTVLNGIQTSTFLRVCTAQTLEITRFYEALTHLVGRAIDIICCKSHTQSHKLDVVCAILILGTAGGGINKRNVP